VTRFLIAVACVNLAACSGSSTAPSAVTSPAPAPVVVTPPAPLPTAPLPVRGPQFDQSFWDKFVHNTFESPTPLPLRRLMTAPMLYLKTVDEAGVPIDPVTLSTVENAMRSVASTWAGGQFGLAGVERGASTKAGLPGWLTVRFSATNTAPVCGSSTVGLDGGTITLNYQAGSHSACACAGGLNVSPHVAKHELGHAFGYYHTDRVDDVMNAHVTTCDDTPSPRETYHATIAYQSPQGTTTALAAPPIRIDN
jgi:hypothetical protein